MTTDADTKLGSKVEAETAQPEANTSVRLPTLRLANQSVVEINSITADQANETVAVSGTVTKQVPLLEGELYQIQDDSDSLWVLSDKPSPAVGESATVEGVVRYEAIVVGEIDAGEVYLQAQSHRQNQ